jgi:hypothetical protein
MAKEAMAKEAQVQGHMVMEAMAQAKICKFQLKSQHLRSILGPVDNRHSTRKTCLAMAKEALVPGPVMEALVPGPVMEAMAQANLSQRHKRPDPEFRMGCHLGSRVYIRLRPSLYPMNS